MHLDYHPNLKQTFFISDLHLQKSCREITKQFIQLLNHSQKMDSLYILGDLFEAWVGDDDRNHFHNEIIWSLKKATANGLPIYFQHGNRDFLIGKKFLTETGCQLLAEEEIINLYGTPVLLMHGDTLCTRDVNYLKMRKIVRNKLVQFLFLTLPLSFRIKIANHLRKKSLYYTQTASLKTMDVTDEAVSSVMSKHHVNYLIHGHTHLPAIHSLADKRERIVLSAWHNRGGALIWDEHGNKKLLDL